MKSIFAVFVFTFALYAIPPMFNDYVWVYADMIPIQVSGGHADPCVVDWDNDGVQDLLLGQYTNGNIRFYRNSGSNAVPEFTKFEYLKADGTVITLPYG
ncbi:MAG: hypothetical protein H8D05_00365 [FCB group bacterium]|nr:hypothetical protein [FCB group bacterium]